MIHYTDDFIDEDRLNQIMDIYSFIESEDLWYDTGINRDAKVFHISQLMYKWKMKKEYSILIKLLREIRDEIKVQFNTQKPIYADSYMAAKWTVGNKQYPHSDSHLNIGIPNDTPWRKYSSVLYLNDECTGGHTYFPDHGITIEPKKGRLTLFDSGLEYKHGVSEVTEGVRKNLIAFWGFDKSVCKEYRI